jgi:predicted nuclease with TOPRIM domain
MPIVALPDGTQVNFPDNATPEMKQAFKAKLAQKYGTPQPTPAAQVANPPGTMVGRAATQALKDTLEVPIRAGKVALKGTVGGLVDLANIAPQVANLLPGTQGVQPISQQPFLGTRQIEDVYQKLGGQAATAESTLGKAAELAGELTAGFVPLTKVASLPGEKLVEQARSAIQSVTPSLSSMGERRAAKQFQEALGPEGLAQLEAARSSLPPELVDQATVAELVQNAPLMRQQEAIQRGLQGQELLQEEARRAALGQAVTKEAERLVPQGGPVDVVQSTVENAFVKDQARLSRIEQRARLREQQKAQLQTQALAAKEESLKASQAHANRIQTLNQNIEKQRRALDAVTSEQAALGQARTVRQAEVQNQIKELDELKNSLELQADDVAAGIRPTGFDVQEVGSRLRVAAEKAVDAAKAQMKELRVKLGLNDNVFVAPAATVQNAYSEFVRDFSSFEQANFPSALKQVENFISTDKDLSFADFEAMRKSLSDAARAADIAGNNAEARILLKGQEFLDNFLSQKSSVADKYKIFRQEYFKNVIEPFYNRTVSAVTGGAQVGYKTASEKVAEQFFKPGAVTRIQDFKRILGDNPEAMADMQAVVLDSLSRAATDANGNFNPRAMNKWLRDNARVLDELPEIREKITGLTEPLKQITAKIADIPADQKTLREGITSLDEQLRQLELKKQAAQQRLDVRTAAGQKASANYDRRMQVLENRKLDLERQRNILENGAKAKRERDFALQVRKQTEENNILKSFVADTPVVAVEKALQSPPQLNRLLSMIGGNQQALSAFRREAWNILSEKSPDEFFTFHRNNEKALNQVFDQQQIESLKQIVDYKKVVESVARAKGKAFGDDVPVHFDTGLTPTTGEGWIRRVLINKTADFLTGNQQEVWKKAMYDKDFAIRLAKFGKSKMTPEETRQEASNLTRMAYLLTLQAAQEE